MTEAEKISEWANVPFDLAEMVVSGAHKSNLAVKDLRSNSRAKHLVRCRWDIARRAKEQGHTYSAIGRALNRDHTTIMHGILWTRSLEAA